MNRSVFKPIIFGVLFGAATFFVPFLIVRMLFFFIIMGMLLRIFWWGGRGRHRMRYHMAYADKIRNMSDEEYTAFKNKAAQHCHHRGYGHREKQKESN